MERVAGLEPPPEGLLGPVLVGGRVHGGPLGREPVGPLEAPVGIGVGNPPSGSFAAQVLEESPPDHLADFRLVVGDEVLGHPVDDLGDAFLPFQVALGHLGLAAGQADHGGGVGGPGNRDGQVLEEGVEVVGHVAVPVDEVQHLVEEDEDGGLRRGEYVPQGPGAGR